MDQTQSFRFFNRGPSPAARLIFFSILSLFLLFVDARYRNLEVVRSVLAVPIQALQRLANNIYTQPGAWWSGFSHYIDTQGNLARQNTSLLQQHATDAARLQQLEMLQLENALLRSYFDLSKASEFPVQIAEIIYSERDIFRRKIIIDKGSNKNIIPGQVVIDEAGVIGQITRVYPWLSEVTLITDKDQAVPIQLQRTGLRAVVFGSGDISNLSLRYLPVSSDVQVGDVLITSGIDGTYPPAIPVATVTSIERDPAYPFAIITCAPIAGVDRHRQLMVISGLQKLPDLPQNASKQVDPKNKKVKRSKP